MLRSRHRWRRGKLASFDLYRILWRRHTSTTTVLATLMAPHLTPLSTPQAAGFGALLGTVGFIGDVVMSAVKRDRGVKDSSTLIPGHGGVLDRVDSLSYTAPVSFYLLYFGFFA